MQVNKVIVVKLTQKLLYFQMCPQWWLIFLFNGSDYDGYYNSLLFP